MNREKLIVIGNGMVSVRLLEHIIKYDGDRFDILVLGKEPFLAYDRIQLSSILSFDKDVDSIILRERSWYETNEIDVRTGAEVVAIDRVKKTVTTSLGDTYPYDRLVLATGSEPITLPAQRGDLRGVLSFRDLNDVESMANATVDGGEAVVIGGGLLGLEAAIGLSKRGMSVTVVHLPEHLLEKQLDATAAEMLMADLQSRDIRFLLKKKTVDFAADETGQVRGVIFEDDDEIAADLVVTAIGIRPHTELAKAAGLDCRRGVIVDDYMRTSDPRIFAVGECVEHRGCTFGLVEPLYQMAKVCAETLHADSLSLSIQPEGFKGWAPSARLKVTGIDVFSAGMLNSEVQSGDGAADANAAAGINAASDELTFFDRAKGVYKKLVLRNDRVIGVVLYGDVEDAAWYLELIRGAKDVAAIRGKLLFGSLAEGAQGPSPDEKLSAMPDDAEICGCNGVCKGTITTAIAGKNLTSLEEVRAHTKASSSCGSCTPLVTALLRLTAGDTAAAGLQKQKISLCKCTDLSHEEVRASIRETNLQTIAEILPALDWKTAEGCHVCRPALNYYLICEFPDTYEDHLPSRWVNERIHANIQKDGTYSVVPRMWGGLTSASDLRVIADVVDKYKIPTVKVTGGQRIDLLGVKKEDLPSVWGELTAAGMVSGHAYAKGLRTCKTCVGSEWCRFGVQDSTTMGVRLERMTWGSWTPAKVKLAASGCPRNCAEATIKDFGVVAVESGWEIHVGGNGGIKVRVADLLCKVKTQEEVLEYCGAFLQLYRKEARFKERTAHWIDRVGLWLIKERVVNDPEARKTLFEEFLQAQRRWQKDPWAELSEKARLPGFGQGFYAISPLQEKGNEHESNGTLDQSLRA